MYERFVKAKGQKNDTCNPHAYAMNVPINMSCLQTSARERFAQANKVDNVGAAIAIASTMGLAAACRSQVTQVRI